MKKILNLKYIPIVVLIFLLISSFFLIVNASQGFYTANTNWKNLYEKMSEDKTDTYPYNSSTATITSVSLDVLYGTTRWSLVQYYGEVPDEQTRKTSGDVLDEYNGIYAYDLTTTYEPDSNSSPRKNDAGQEYKNPKFGATTQPTAKDFWGFEESDTTICDPDKDHNYSLTELEQANSTDRQGVKSLRLYALQNVHAAFNWLYIVGVAFGYVATIFIKLILMVKNISMDTVLNLLGLKKLSETITSALVYDSKTGKWSVFLTIMIVLFIIALVGYAIKWVKGSQKTQGLWNIVIYFLVGLLIIGMAITNRTETLGQSFANITSKLLYAVSGELSGAGTVGNVFVTDITDNENENEIIQLQEMTLLNRAYMNIQIGMQFDVTDIDTLDVTTLGDTDYSLAEKYLGHLDGNSFKDDFGGNLGYYFWFANSSAKNKTKYNATYPELSTATTEAKTSSMITYLQVLYNKAIDDGDTDRQETIRKLILGFSNPSGARGFLNLLVFSIDVVILGIVLFLYGLKVVTAKLELFVALLGIPVAGPFILSSNEKLIKTAKVILGMIVVSMMHITVWSVIFDVILYVFSSIIQPNLLSELVALFFILLLLKLLPIINEKVMQLLNTAERSISPALSDAKRSIKAATHRLSGDAMRKAPAGSLRAKTAAIINNSTGSATGRKSTRRILQEQNQIRHDADEKDKQEQRKLAENEVQNALDNIEGEKNYINGQINEAEAKQHRMENIYGTDENGNKCVVGRQEVYENLNGSQLAMKKKMDELNAEIDALKNSNKYKNLNEKKLNGTLSTAEAQELTKCKTDLLKLQNEMKNQKRTLDNNIRVNAANKITGGSATNEAEIQQDVAKMAQSKYKNSLESALNEVIARSVEDANKPKDNLVQKIGKNVAAQATTDSVNREAIQSYTTASYQLNELHNGEEVSSKKDVDMATQKISNTIADSVDKGKLGTVKDNINQSTDDAYESIKTSLKGAANAVTPAFTKKQKDKKASKQSTIDRQKEANRSTTQKHKDERRQKKEDTSGAFGKDQVTQLNDLLNKHSGDIKSSINNSKKQNMGSKKSKASAYSNSFNDTSTF